MIKVFDDTTKEVPLFFDKNLQLLLMIYCNLSLMMTIRDIGLVESSVAQPKMTFDGKDLYPSIYEKAGILGFSLIKNHAFIDGNKRIGHAAIEIFLLINGYE